MNDTTGALCDDQLMNDVLAAAQADAETGVATIDRALDDYPLDPRLHFLKGSLLVGLRRFVGAHIGMSRALEIAPDYHLARFQLGFFELTSGEADSALRTWEPLAALPEGHWMRLFVEGLRCLAADRFADAIAALRAGIVANDENASLNRDMELIIAECEKLGEHGAAGGASQEEVSATSFLLRATTGGRRH